MVDAARGRSQAIGHADRRIVPRLRNGSIPRTCQRAGRSIYAAAVSRRYRCDLGNRLLTTGLANPCRRHFCLLLPVILHQVAAQRGFRELQSMAAALAGTADGLSPFPQLSLAYVAYGEPADATSKASPWVVMPTCHT